MRPVGLASADSVLEIFSDVPVEAIHTRLESTHGGHSIQPQRDSIPQT